jgi:polar amino acid transport system permease protein
VSTLLEQAHALFSQENMIFVLAAMGRTLWMTLMGCAFGFIAGMLLALLRRSTRCYLAPARLVAAVYVEVFRRIPFLVILFIVLFAIGPLAPDASLFTIAAVSICLLATAFLSEIVGAGLDSVPATQVQAAEALNLGRLRTLRYVVLPQAWKVILPPAIAFGVMFIKDTALASQMGVVELTFAGKVLVNRGTSPALGFGLILLCYFALSYPLTRLGAHLERRLATSRH